jgi:hypothetical protein
MLGTQENGWQLALPAVCIKSNYLRLPTAATVASASAVGSATAAMEPTASASSGIAPESARVDCGVAAEAVIVMDIAAMEPAIPAESAIAAESTITTEPVSIVESAAAETMEPRPSADKNAAPEILGAVVTIGRASVGVITIVTIGADWRGTNIARANSDPHSHLGVRCANREN